MTTTSVEVAAPKGHHSFGEAVEDAVEGSGLRPIDLRALGILAIAGIVGIALAGAVAPTIFTPLTEAEVLAGPDNRMGIAYFALFFAYAAAWMTVAWVAAVRLTQARWTWPIGPSVERPARREWHRPDMLALATMLAGNAVLQPLLRHVGGLYSDDGATFLRVVTAVNLAMSTIIAITLYAVGFAAGLLILALVGYRRRTNPS